MNEPRLNLPELTVSELSAALKRTIEDAYGYVRVRGELGKVSYHANGHVYFDLKDERACIAGVIWRTTARPHQAQARSRPRSGDHRAADHLSRPLAIPDRGRDAGAGRPRCADGAARRAQAPAGRRGPVRRSAQAAPAVPACGDRRDHVADRRRHSRHSAPACRPLPAPRAGLAGKGAGRRLGRRSRRRHRRLQRASRSGEPELPRPDLSSSRAAAARSRICGRSTKRSWCAPRRRA